MIDIEQQTLALTPMETDDFQGIEELERTFCTNFLCCNTLLPDLHALLDHYDIKKSGHSLNAKTPVPFEDSPSSSPPSSPGIQTPESSPPRRFVSLWPISSPTYISELAASHPLVYQSDSYAPDYPTYEHCYNAATKPPTLDKPLLSDVIPEPLRNIGSEIGDVDKGRRSPSSAPSVERKQHSAKRKGKVDLTGTPLAASRKRAKKAYQCPTPGCTKSYLNPNGLKYHQEKGKCKIEVFPATDVESMSPPATTSASALLEALSPNSTLLQHPFIYHPQPRQSLSSVVQWVPTTSNEPQKDDDETSLQPL